MRVFGYELVRGSALKAQLVKELAAVRDSMGGWFGVIRESFSGAFQAAIEVDAPRDILSFSGLYAPITLIAGDIAKLRIRLTELKGDIWREVADSPFLRVLRKPNHYQTRLQFIELWIISKLIFGNVYVLKERESFRGMVKALYILDPQRITPLVADNGNVYYRLTVDHLSHLTEALVVPASEMIHDRWNCLWHPLVGIAPIYAAGMSATQGRRIQANSATFFKNMSRPGGMLTAPGKISNETAQRLKGEFEQNFSAGNLGRLFVGGDGLKYEGMAVPAEQSQLIEQLKWTIEDIARCYHVPLFMVGGPAPANASIEAETLRYYTQCLQKLIEAAEACLDEGLELPANYCTEFDLDGLIRMDTAAQYEALGKAISGGWLAPNEARRRVNLPPVTGGESPMIQQQNYSLAALAKRDAREDPFAAAPSKAAPVSGDVLPEAADGEADADEDVYQELGALLDFTSTELTTIKAAELVAA